MATINNLVVPNIRIFVFGTLRLGGRLDYYMEGSSPLGLYYTQGQLMESTAGSAYIDFSDEEAATIGELYHVNYPCLQRINHLESTSGEFPRAYDLDLLPVWPCTEGEPYTFNEEKKMWAFFYRRRSVSRRIKSGDWMKRKNPIEEIGRLLREETGKTLYPQDLLHYMETFIKT